LESSGSDLVLVQEVVLLLTLAVVAAAFSQEKQYGLETPNEKVKTVGSQEVTTDMVTLHLLLVVLVARWYTNQTSPRESLRCAMGQMAVADDQGKGMQHVHSL
jgi:uncharacterized protein YggE